MAAFYLPTTQSSIVVLEFVLVVCLASRELFLRAMHPLVKECGVPVPSYASALFIFVANCRSKPTNAVDATDSVRSRRYARPSSR